MRSELGECFRMPHQARGDGEAGAASRRKATVAIPSRRAGRASGERSADPGKLRRGRVRERLGCPVAHHEGRRTLGYCFFACCRFC